MQLGDLPHEDCAGLTDRHISIEDAMRVKVAKLDDAVLDDNYGQILIMIEEID